LAARAQLKASFWTAEAFLRFRGFTYGTGLFYPLIIKPAVILSEAKDLNLLTSISSACEAASGRLYLLGAPASFGVAR